MLITKQQLDAILEKDSLEWYPLLQEYFTKYQITTEDRIAGFLAQTVHESNHFKVLSENLNYSSKRLNQVFPKYFVKAGRNAEHYHYQPEKIANVVYANRMSNGGVDSGDGWRFRGGGLLQLTGKHNYTKFAKHAMLTVEQAAEYVRTPRGAVHSACWFWKENSLNVLCDRGDIVTLSKRINGGTIGLSERIELWNNIHCILAGKEIRHTVRRGDIGPSVKKVQQFLGLKADGLFGAKTEAAVKQWQLLNGLAPDGVVGPHTYRKMLSEG